MEEEQNTSVLLSNGTEGVPAWMWTYLAYWMLIVTVIGIPMNALVIFIWATLSSSSNNRRLSSIHSKNRWFILSMTCGDLIFLALHTSTSYVWYGSVVNMTDGPCYTYYVGNHLSAPVSSMSLLLLNVDKFIYLHWPLHYHTMMTTKRAMGLTLGVWLTSITWMLIFVFGPFLKRDLECNWVTQHKEYYFVFLIMFFVLPILLSTATSLYIATIAIRTSIQEAAMQAVYQQPSCSDFLSPDLVDRKTSSGPPAAAVTLNGRPSTSSTLSTVKSWRTITFVFTTTIWSTITCLPYRISLLVSLLTVTDRTKIMPLLALTVAYAAGNPFITIFTQPPYRKRALDMFTNTKTALSRLIVRSGKQ